MGKPNCDVLGIGKDNFPENHYKLRCFWFLRIPPFCGLGTIGMEVILAYIYVLLGFLGLAMLKFAEIQVEMSETSHCIVIILHSPVE